MILGCASLDAKRRTGRSNQRHCKFEQSGIGSDVIIQTSVGYAIVEYTPASQYRDFIVPVKAGQGGGTITIRGFNDTEYAEVFIVCCNCIFLQAATLKCGALI